MKKSTLLLLALAASPAAAQVTRTSTLVDTTTVGTAVAPNVASFDNLSVATYLDNGNNEVYAVASDAAGLVWGAPVRVDRDTTASSKFVGFQRGNETVHVHMDHVYITWRDDRNGAFDDVYFNRSTDAGVSFELLDQRLDNSSLPGVSSVRDWSMTVSRNPFSDPDFDIIYVLLSVEVIAGGSEDLFLVGSFDGGASFGAAVPVSTANGTGADVDDISVCAFDRIVVCTWTDNRSGSDDQYVRVSTDGGLTFGAEIVLNSTPGTGNTGESVDAYFDASGKVAVSFGDNLSGATEVWAAVSPDFGVTWPPSVQVGSYIPGTDDTDNAQITVSGPNVVAVWEDNRSGGDDVYTAYSPDMGVTWLPDALLSVGGAGFPRLSKDSFQNIVVVWTGGGFPEDSLGAYSLDAGVTFIPVPTPISDTTGDSDFTELGFNPRLSNAVVCWLSDDTGTNRLYCGGFAICNPATVTNRSAVPNPDAYVASTSTLGGTFTGTIDATITGHSLTGLVGFLSPLTLTLSGGQVLLVNIADAGGELFGFAPIPGPLATYSTLVPNDPALCFVTVYSQGILVGGVTPFALTNAQDLLIGAF